MKKKVAMLILILLLAVSMFPSVAFAEGPGNSEPGADRYGEISSNPNPDAQCGTGAGSGSFGYFGKDKNLGNDVSGHYREGGLGANGYQTGLNNSAVCGRP